jgi:hypothetical protein
MTDHNLIGSLHADEEYRTIEAALLESPRGRWFLAEHGRRSRRVDAQVLDDVIARLQASLREPPALLSVLRSDVERLRGYVGDQRQEMAANVAGLLSQTPHGQPHGQPMEASAQHHAVNMLTAAEDLHALVWSLRDQVPNPDFCEAIARQASRIYAMSHAQAVESARATQFTAALDETYQRLSALLETILFEMKGVVEETSTARHAISNGLVSGRR